MVGDRQDCWGDLVSEKKDNSSMNPKQMILSAKIVADAAPKSTRRHRDILANSGEMMESGEVRDLDNMYVMGTDGELYRIADLNTDPEKQTEEYSVRAQADHGEEVEWSDLPVPTIEKQFGSCRVWMEKDGLHARMYFANNDKLADHAYAISRDAGYSIGAYYYPDGYETKTKTYDGAIGILREISMVITGNDPRAKALDHLKQPQEGVTDAADANDGNNINHKENTTMNKKVDALSDEDKAEVKALVKAAIAEADAEAKEASEEKTETEVEAPADTEEEAKTEDTPATDGDGAAEATADKLHMPIVVVRDRVAKQETGAAKSDWLTSKAGHKAFADTLRSVGHFGGAFDAAWRQEASKHMSLDGITGLPAPVPVEQIFVDVLEKADGIISHFRQINTKSFRVKTLYPDNDEAGRAKGHTKGQTKQFQAMTALYRDVLSRMIYKKLDLDAMEIYENPELIDFRARELVEAWVREIERGAFIGDGRSAGTPDLRIFDGTRGIQPIVTDTAASTGMGTYLAGTVTAGRNFYESVQKAKAELRTEGRTYVVAKSAVITDLVTTILPNGNYLIAPGASVENVLGVSRVYTPSWMDNADVDGFVVVDGAYALIGETSPTSRGSFNTTTNTDELLVEGPRGGSLVSHKGAIAIAAES